MHTRKQAAALIVVLLAGFSVQAMNYWVEGHFRACCEKFNGKSGIAQETELANLPFKEIAAFFS